MYMVQKELPSVDIPSTHFERSEKEPRQQQKPAGNLQLVRLGKAAKKR